MMHEFCKGNAYAEETFILSFKDRCRYCSDLDHFRDRILLQPDPAGK